LTRCATVARQLTAAHQRFSAVPERSKPNEHGKSPGTAERRSDVIHGRAGGPRLGLGDVGDRVLREHLARSARGIREHARGAAANWAVEQLHELEHADLAGLAGEGVAALHAALRAQDPGPPERGEQLLEEL